MKILYATDGSVPSLAAFRSLLDRLAWFAGGVDLTILNVHPAIPFKRAAAWAGQEALKTYYDEECDAALAGAIAEATARNIPFKSEPRIGEPASTIVAVARDEKFDVIALGAVGHSALSHLMLGSVAQKVVASSKVPVLLLR